MSVDLRVGDTRELVRTLTDGSVALVATSPPFLALRSYLPADHPDKHAEIGSEPDPASFLATLLELTAEWGRVLAPWGSIAVELGDTYSGSGGGGGDYLEGGMREGQAAFAGSSAHARESKAAHWRQKAAGKSQWPRAKCLALIPQLYAASLAYGRNLLTGEPCEQWLVRNLIVWHRANPAVGALGDKFRPSTSYIVVATRSNKRWFDLTAVRGAASPNTHARSSVARFDLPSQQRDGNWSTLAQIDSAAAAGAPPQDCWFDQHDTWSVNAQPSGLAHYAMWPPKLAERLILSMCPEWVCATCGQPRQRIEKVLNSVGKAVRSRNEGRGQRFDCLPSTAGPQVTKLETLGWSDCGHDNYTAGVVFDPFAGTGTTLAVADLHGRHGVGFELNPASAALYDARRAEVARNLFGTTPELPGQQDLFGAA